MRVEATVGHGPYVTEAAHSNSRCTMRTVCLAVALFMAVPTMLSAQRQTSADSVPRAGEWAAEVVLGPSITGASVVRFTSPSSALLVGADFNVSHYNFETNAINGEDRSYTTTGLNARLGLRHYRESSTERLRPLLGVGARGGYSKITDNADSHTWNAGVYGELGAVYFVASHVSLGATGELFVVHQEQKQGGSSGFTATSKSTAFGGSLVRVLASVYF
jgi:hypothetical protein